jgi:cell division protein FtsB
MQWMNNIGDSLFAWRGKFVTGGISVLALMLAYHVVLGQNGWVAYHEKKLEYQRLQMEVKDIQAENDRFEKQIKSLKTDPRAIEKEAREQLHYANPNEVIVVMPAAKPQQQNLATAQKR